MFGDKLFALLSTFSKYELNRFRKFLLSPYFNDQEDVTRLFELLNTAVRKNREEQSALQKDAVWKTLYPRRPYDDAHLRRLVSDLLQLAQQFLVEELRRKDHLSEAIELFRVLDKPELQKHTDAAERQVQKLLQQAEGQTTDLYYARFQFQYYSLNHASKKVAAGAYSEKLALADFHLECYYLTQKLKLYVAWLLYKGFRVTEREVPTFPGFWEYLHNPRFDEVPLILIYRKTILSFTDSENETHFSEWLDVLDRFATDLSKNDLRESFIIAQNYCALKINQGKTAYYQRYFDLVKNLVKHDALLEESGQLPESVFKNYITISLGVGEFAWTEQFIQRYSEFLPERIRENARIFNLAYVCFYKKEYSKVIEYLRDVEYSDVVYALGAKSILVRTYYEQRELLALDSLIDSFKIFLRRNKVISKNLKREYNNFLNLVKKLTTLTASDRKGIEQLQRRMSETSHEMPRNWLIKKLREIEGKG